MADEQIPERTFVIDNGKKGAGAAHAGVYSINGSTRTFAEVKVVSDERPDKNAIVLRYRDGQIWETTNTNRAYDALHFVMLLPCGDDGWRSKMERGVSARVQPRSTALCAEAVGSGAASTMSLDSDAMTLICSSFVAHLILRRTLSSKDWWDLSCRSQQIEDQHQIQHKQDGSQGVMPHPPHTHGTTHTGWHNLPAARAPHC